MLKIYVRRNLLFLLSPIKLDLSTPHSVTKKGLLLYFFKINMEFSHITLRRCSLEKVWAWLRYEKMMKRWSSTIVEEGSMDSRRRLWLCLRRLRWASNQWGTISWLKVLAWSSNLKIFSQIKQRPYLYADNIFFNNQNLHSLSQYTNSIIPAKKRYDKTLLKATISQK